MVDRWKQDLEQEIKGILDKIESIEGNMIKVADKMIPIGESYKKSFQILLEKKRIV